MSTNTKNKRELYSEYRLGRKVYIVDRVSIPPLFCEAKISGFSDGTWAKNLNGKEFCDRNWCFFTDEAEAKEIYNKALLKSLEHVFSQVELYLKILLREAGESNNGLFKFSKVELEDFMMFLVQAQLCIHNWKFSDLNKEGK